MKATAALPTPTELADFFGELRQAGYQLDPRQLAAAERLLLMVYAREPQTEFARLKTLLAPVFVTSPVQQADFYNRFDAWVGRRRGGPVVIQQNAGQNPDRKSDVRRERRWRWRLIVGAAGVLLAIGVGTWGFMVQEQSKANPAYPIDAPRSAWVAVQTTLTALPLAALILWIGIRWKQRSLWLERQASGEVPELDRARLPRESRWLFGSPGFHHTAQNLRRHGRVPTTDLDIHKTIEATVAQAGLFTPINTKYRLTPEYLFLIEQMGADDHVARLTDEALDRLEDEGVAVERCYFSRDPRVCFRNDGRRTPIALSELAARTAGHRLVIVGTADGFFHPVSGCLEKWVTALEVWPGRVIMSPRPLRHWSINELALLQNGFSLATATPKGFSALGNYISFVEEAPAGALLEGALVATPLMD